MAADLARSRRRPPARRVRSTLVLSATAILAVPGTARAHAAIVSSQPEPGQELATAPGVVVLEFSEPLNVSLSRATVTDPTGRSFTGAASDDREIRVPLTTNAIGVYDVDWVSVSTLDGHTLRGSLRFGVGVAPGPGSEGEIGTSPQASDLLVAVLRALEYAALLVAVGMLLLRRLGRAARLDWVRPRIALAFAVAFAGGLAVVVGEAISAAGSLSIAPVIDFLTTGASGAWRTVRLVAEALALVAALIGRGAVLFLVVAVVALSASGHAAAVPFGVPVDAAHLVAAGLWAGGILALATLRPPGGWRGSAGGGLLQGFSSVALPAFVLTVATGALRGIQELSGVADLILTPYGQVLSLKVLAVLLMVPLSMLAWRRVLGSPRLEAGVALAVVGAAALLAAFPLPPGRAAETDEAEEAATSEIALPRDGDLTLGGDAGEVLVGLTIRPAEPGPNEVLVYLLPLDGEEAAAGIPATITTEASSVETVSCGSTCRRAELDLRGDEDIAVEVGTEVGGTASFHIPVLPAPDGSELVSRLQGRMHRLTSYRQIEVLSAGRGATRSTYAFVAPDRYMSRSVHRGEVTAEVVVIGQTRWLRLSGESRWEEQTGGPAPDVPSLIWDYFAPPVAPRIVGAESVEGTQTRIVSFFGSGTTPIWFRLWVDERGLVREAEMRAQGHFMDHWYLAFDAPIVIEPPRGASVGSDG
jgi:copper transport protein